MAHNNTEIYYVIGRIMGIAQGLPYLTGDDLWGAGKEISSLAYSIVASDLDPPNPSIAPLPCPKSL